MTQTSRKICSQSLCPRIPFSPGHLGGSPRKAAAGPFLAAAGTREAAPTAAAAPAAEKPPK